MIIFVGNLPDSVAEQDLCALAYLPVGGQVRIFKKQGHDGCFHRYALVAGPGRKSVQTLRNKRLNGNVLDVREFVHRTAGNERRRLDWRAVPWVDEERRLSERRYT